MQFSNTPPRHRAFLLRCWEEREDLSHASHWRYSLEEVGTDTRRGFTQFKALVTFLENQLTTHPSTLEPS